MNPEFRNEIWQIEVGGEIYEAPLAELPSWIGEGSLQPGDKVRKGNLRWIEAQRVPALIPFFNARQRGEPMPVVQTLTDANSEDLETSAICNDPRPGTSPELKPIGIRDTLTRRAVQTDGGFCTNHADRPIAYVCPSCTSGFCKVCPKSFGGNVRLCPGCGAMCRTSREVQAEAKRFDIESTFGAEPFGFPDLVRSVTHPFRFKPSLFFGGLMYAFFSFGESAASIGGIFLIAASLMCMMLANMLVFGIRANVIDNFTQGRLDTDFMPSFDDFSLWSDVVHPFFVYLGALISSFGAFFLVAAVGAYLIISSANEQMNKFNEELTRVPGTQFYAPDRTAEQSQEVREVLEKVRKRNDRNAEQGTLSGTAEPRDMASDPPPQPSDQEQMDQLLNEIRERQMEQAIPSTTGGPVGVGAVVSNILRLAAPIVVLGMITFLWGLFYYPAACAVAGYTRSFTAAVNPLVGLDTIRRLGINYVKLLAIGLLLLLCAGVVAAILRILFMPFDLPRVGNIPAMVVGSFATFYFSIVFSCLLGFVLLRSAGRLNLCR